tara:strand:+ start:18644 stop:19591 length:948 start_codon:yes stop_codon:yes gene_type:complete
MGAIQIISDNEVLPESVHRTVASIGVFDGVHKGHQKLLDLVKGKSISDAIPSVVITFDQHPTEVTSPENAPKVLTPLSKKILLLDELGIDYVYVLAFNENRALTPAVEFINEIFVDAIRAKAIFVGEDFKFGHKRTGNVDLLKSEGQALGISVNGVGLFNSESSIEEPISSTAIRKHLKDGELAAANEKLGRPYSISGKVVTGDQRGRAIGFPTANIKLDTKIALPSDGVYAATYLGQDGASKVAAVNIGKRPTFSDGTKSVVEAHLLDFEGNLYGDDATITFHKRIRSERKFAGLEEFQLQLEIDLTKIRELLT